MNEWLWVLKFLVGAILTLVFGLNAKIIWDWFNRDKSVFCDVSKLVPRIEEITTKLDNLSKVVMGNGKIENSIVFRISKIEELIDEIKKIRESRGL